MKGRRIVPVLLVALLIPGPGTAPARASSPEELFAAGNDAYEKERFEEAAAAYEKILDYGLRDPRVDYNLGNAYFRMGRLGAAILHFERALRVDPTDVEARDNLDLARGRIRDRAEAPEAPYPVKVLRDLVEAPAFAFLEGLFLALYVAAGGLVGALLLSRGEARRRLLGYGALCLGLGMLLSGGALVFRIREATANQAIVMQDKVDVRAGPAEDNTVLFTVHEGTRVEVRSRVDGWYQVSLPSALSGWLPVASVERV